MERWKNHQRTLLPRINKNLSFFQGPYAFVGASFLFYSFVFYLEIIPQIKGNVPPWIWYWRIFKNCFQSGKMIYVGGVKNIFNCKTKTYIFIIGSLYPKIEERICFVRQFKLTYSILVQIVLHLKKNCIQL